MQRASLTTTVFAAGAFGIFLCRCGAQTPQPTAPSQDTPVLHSDATLVLLDVVALDHGKVVHGLDRQQFHVFEDGHERPIDSFEEHTPNSTPLPGASLAALPPHVYSNVPQYPEATAINVLLLDGLNTPTSDQINVREQMLQFMGTIQPGTPLAIFTLTSRLHLVEGFTTDVAALTKALKSPQAGGHPSVLLDGHDDPLDQQTNDLISQLDTSGESPIVVALLQQFQADTKAYETDQRVGMTLGALQELARYLGAMPGRKNLIWFSGSFPLELFPDESLANPFSASRNYAPAIKKTNEMLEAARVAVYPVDARGLMAMPAFSASNGQSTRLKPTKPAGPSGGAAPGMANLGASRTGAESTPAAAKDSADFMKETDSTFASMKEIAQATGGKEFINTNGLKEAVASAIDDGSSYYTISFIPDAKKLNGKYHKLAVKVDKGDYKLAYRNGFFADPTEKLSSSSPEQVTEFKVATLHGALPATQITFKAHVMESTDPSLRNVSLPAGPAGDMAAALKGPVRRYVVDLNVDPHGLTFKDMPDGRHEALVELLLIAYDEDGNRINALDNSFRVQFDAAQYAHALASGISTNLALDIPAGPHDLRIAVHDLTSGNVGSLEVPVTPAK